MLTENFKIIITKSNKSILAIEKFSLTEGKINFLLGESGIGKTIISKTIIGILDSKKFNIKVNNENYDTYILKNEVVNLKRDGFFVFQEPSTHFNPLLKIGTQLKEGNLGTGKNERKLLKKLWQNSEEKQYLSLLKVYPKPFRPSGGEKQRFLLIMALKKIDKYLESKSKVIPLFIFDEPTGSLDDQLRNWFLNILFTMYKEKPFTVLFITHDYSIISEILKKYANMRKYVVFNELKRKRNKVIQLPFDENEYISWISQSQKSFKNSRNKNEKCLLEIESDIKVFDKNIDIYNYENAKSSLKIHQGEIVYLKAPSGMGKTSIAKIIMGLIKANNVTFYIKSEKYTGNTPQKIWKRKLWGKVITMAFQHADEALNLNSTVRQTLLNIPRIKRPKPNELISKLETVFDSDIDQKFLKKEIRQLSGGQKQRINLLRALLLDTPLLILDEPLNGLDFISIQKVINIIQERANKGTGILLISHNEEIMESIINKESTYFLSEV